MGFLLYAIPILLGLVIVEIVTDRVRKKRLFGFHDTISSLSLAVGNQIVNLFINLLILWVYINLYDHLALFHIEPSVLSFFFCLFLFDFCFYWEHRLSHEINFLWGTHVVHHSSEEYNLSVAIRRSWFVNLVVMFFFLPIPILGFDIKIFLGVMAIHNVFGYLQHTKTIGKLHPIIEFIFNTPSHHRVHHGVNPKYVDKNYSGMFVLYDRLFGTFQVEEEEPTYGITTPLKAWDPIWAHLHYYAYLFQTARKISNWKDRLKLFVARPGWHPKELGGFKKPPPVDPEQYQRYTIRLPKILNQYVLWQFLLSIVGVLAISFIGMSNFSGFYQAGFSMVILLASVIPAALFDRKRWSGIAEYIRLGLSYIILNSYFFVHQPDYSWSLLFINTVLFGFFFWWFKRAWDHRFQVEEGMEEQAANHPETSLVRESQTVSR